MIKYFCDKCGKEVPIPYCLYTMGVILCSEKCRKEFEDEHRVGNVIMLPKRKIDREVMYRFAKS